MAATAKTATKKAERQRIYLERLNAFFEEVKTWLPEDLETAEILHEVRDKTGEYKAPGMAILKKGVPEPDDDDDDDNVVAKLLPQGCSLLWGGEGLIELHGPFDEESIVYLLVDCLMACRYHSGKLRPMFKGLNSDGWYWMEDPRRSRVQPFNGELLIELLGLTSDYELPE
ncbi:MAG: hypothetical protein GY862_33235 [Gammaproteobacteria bacterium]|nr:hypothetical protein [Gammaproteobacteria bacterium]